MKFQPNSFNSIKLSGRKIGFSYVTRGKNLKNKHARVMVLVHDTSFYCALQKYEVSLKYSLRLLCYRADTK